MKRGILYMVWDGPPGTSGCGQVLERSRASARDFLPGVPQEVIRCDAGRGLLNKTAMGALTPFQSTLFLDADTVILGDLRWAWDQAERHGLACCINPCPWLRRYGNQWKDMIEYNTGVLFFTQDARPTFDLWDELSPASPGSRFLQGDTVCGLECDDQWAFSRAVEGTGICPFILPFNYNFQPGWFTRFFTPVKVWHSVYDVPPGLAAAGAATEAGGLTRFCEMAPPPAG